MTTLPDEIVTRIVHGRYIVPIIDGADPDQRPDATPAKGSFAFISSLGYIPVFETTEGPVTMMNVPIIGVLDDDGYLCTPIPGTMNPMYRGVTLYTTDNPVLAVTDWTWNVVYKFDAHGSTALSIPAHGFALPSGPPVDLTTLAKVPSSPGYGLPQAEAALLRAEQAATDAAVDAAAAIEAAGRAEAAAGATDTGVATLLGDPLTDTGGLLDEKLSVKADTATVYETLSTKADLDGGLVPDAQTPAGVTSSLNSLDMVKADKATVENDLAFKADDAATTAALGAKADLETGKVPVAQLPAATTSTAGTLAALDKAKLNEATASNVVSTLVYRNSEGNFSVAEPASLTHPATKGYVDTELVTKADLIGGLLPDAQVPARLTESALSATIGEQVAPVAAALAASIVDPGERIIAKLDQGVTPVRFALAGDSTGDFHTEWFHRGVQSIVDSYPQTAGFLWCEYYYNGTASTGGAAYKRFRLAPIGATYDEFDTAGELVGKTSASGQTWTGTAGIWTVTDGSAVTSATAAATLSATVPHAGFGRRVSGRFILDTSTPAAERAINFDFGADASNMLTLKVAVSTGGVVFSSLVKTIGGAVTSGLMTLNPLTSITAGGEVEIPFSLEVDTTKVTLYINGNSGAYTMTAGDFTALGGMTMLRMRGTTQGGVKVGRIGLGDLAESPRLIEVWNGSKAGSTLDAQAADFATLYPTPLDGMFISSSHNYLDDTDAVYATRAQAFIDLVRAAHPDAGIIMSSQNPEYAPAAFGFRAAHNKRLVGIRTFAISRGYGYIPAAEAFFAQPDGGLSLVNTDGVHPLQTGSNLWGSAFTKWAKAKSLRP